MNFPLKGAQHFSSKGTSIGECKCYWNLPEGTTAKAQGTTAIAVMGAKGYFEPLCFAVPLFIFA